jgi:hypothetical protein
VVARAEADQARRRERVTGSTVLISAVVICLLSAGITVSSATTRADDVARRVASLIVEPVAQRVLALGRAETARGARDDINAANVLLTARRLPIFEQPPPDAPNYIVQRQEARAWAMVDYPDALAEQVRDEVRRGERPATQPIASTAPPAPSGDGVVTTIPVTPPGTPTLVEIPPRSSAAPTGRSPAAPPAARTPPGPGAPAAPAPPAPPAPAPPAPQPNQRGLLPLLPDLPIRVPLLSE